MTERLIGYVVLLVVLGSPSGAWFGLTRAQVPAALAADRDGLHVLVTVQGHTVVKRKGWSNYWPAMFGTSLRRGDLLRLEGTAQARVICAGLTMHDVPQGISGVPCEAAQPVLRYLGDLVISTRGAGPGLFPIVVSPRKTKVLNRHPILRWTPMVGATAYRVVVRGRNLQWRWDVGSETEIIYPEFAPALKPGESYKLIVAASGRRSDEESDPGLGFTVLSSDEAKTVVKEEKKILALGLSAGPTRFLIAYLYAAFGLKMEAIDQLEELTMSLKEPVPMRLLADLYLAIGLTRQAEARYLAALALSKSANDEEGQALANDALGRIYNALGNRSQAIQHLSSAVALFRELGDQEMTRQIEELLARLK